MTVPSIRVLFFSQAREAAGVSEVFLPCDTETNATELRAALVRQFHRLEPILISARLARNHCYSSPDERFFPGDEIAIIPPVSGG